MKTLSIFFIAILLLPFSTQAKRSFEKLSYPPLNELKLPEIKKFDLSNGIKVRYLKDTKLPIVNINIILKGGDTYSPLGKLALSELPTSLMRIGGAGKFSGEEIDELIENKGTYISINSFNDYIMASLSTLSENLDEALKIFALLLREPKFEDEKLKELKTKMKSSIARRNDQPMNIMSREFQRIIYGDKSPLGAFTEYRDINNVTKKDIIDFHKNYFNPDNMILGAIGAVELADLKTHLKKHFEGWKGKSNFNVFKFEENKSNFTRIALANKENLTQSYLLMGHLGPIYDLKEIPKIKVFDNILSSGMDSRLFTEVRTKQGLTYGTWGGINPSMFYPGYTYYGTFTKLESTKKAIDAIFTELARIKKEKVTAEELANAKDYLINSFVFKYDSPDAILQRALMLEFYGLPQDADKIILEDVKKVTIDDVLETANKYLRPEAMTVLVVSDEKKVQDMLNGLGKVKKIDIAIPKE